MNKGLQKQCRLTHHTFRGEWVFECVGGSVYIKPGSAPCLQPAPPQPNIHPPLNYQHRTVFEFSIAQTKYLIHSFAPLLVQARYSSGFIEESRIQNIESQKKVNSKIEKKTVTGKTCRFTLFWTFGSFNRGSSKKESKEFNVFWIAFYTRKWSFSSNFWNPQFLPTEFLSDPGPIIVYPCQ